MMDTTTPTDGAVDTAQPTTNEAVTDTVVLQPTTVDTSPSQDDTAAVAETDASPAPETQADDITTWAEKKGLPMDDPAKLAQMVRESEKRMHEATERAKELETSMVNNPTLDYTGDENYDALAVEVNRLKIQNSVSDYFRANPDAREYESEMAQIVQERPHLQGDLDALYALAVNSPNRAAELKSEGGRQALTNLAQKQQAVPPTAQASTGTSVSSKITPDNVDELVAKNDNNWFKKNYDAINQAMAGTR